jgi:hypothetical protein
MSNFIGSKLSYEHRKALADFNFKIGAVLKFFDKVAEKEKILILTGIKYDKITVAFVRINTGINEKFFPTAALKNEHLALLKDEEKRPFLKHDFFVDCSTFVIQKSDTIYNILITDPSIHLGQLCENDLLDIKEKISTSRMLSPSQKKEFGLFFNPKNRL